MKTKIIILILISAFIWTAQGEAKPRVKVIAPNNGFQLGIPNQNDNPNAITQERVFLEPNKIKSFIINTGIFDQNIDQNNSPGFEWPKGAGTHAIFTAGITVAARVDGILKMCAASYEGEWAPGYAENGAAFTDSKFRLYSIKAGDNATNNPDYAAWGDMVPYGAPYVDVNGNNVYEPGIDVPGIKDANQTVYICLTDGFQDQHNSSEGFGGGTTPLFAQMHMTAWAYNISGIQDMQFLRFEVMNKNTLNWDSTHFGVVVDPDLGFAEDDYIACDTVLNMAICYNSTNTDGSGAQGQYGTNPPASGMDYFVSPVNRATGDTLGLTSFVYFINPSTPGATCERDPDNPTEAYRYLQGKKSDGTSWVDPTQTPPKKTVYAFPGDPESNIGWTEAKGRIDNCGGDSTGTPVVPNPGGDRRFIFNSGSTNFQVTPGDTQTIVLVQFVAKGSNNLNAVTKLKRLDKTAQKLFDADFNVIPPPPTPVTTIGIEQKGGPTSSYANITISWNDTAESYVFRDTVLSPDSITSIYYFQGYEVYEVKKSADNLPDFNQPSTINNDLTLLATYDKIDTVGIIQDSLSFGISVNGNEQLGYFPVVPPYTYSVPAGFPNSGLFRSLRVTSTKYPEEYGGNADFIYGQEYKFVVVAYAYSSTAQNGLKVMRSPLTSFSVIPKAPLAGTQTFYTNGDTLNTNRRDLGLAPIILNKDQLVDATYRVQFNADTTYNIRKSTGGTGFVNLAQNIKVDTSVGAFNFDGIEFKVRKITKSGVIRDSIANPRQNQSRQYGWSYDPPGNKFVEGSKYLLSADRPYQSPLMGLSWPTQGTYTNLPSLVKANELKNIEIEFTGTGGAGQMAYRYHNSSLTQYVYKDFVEVPFRAYEVDPTDSTGTRRQINVAFLVKDSTMNTWSPTADSLGGSIVTYFFRSSYNSTPDPFYTSKNLFIQQGQTDIYYIWSPKLVSAGASYTVGDKMGIYPYMLTRANVEPGYPFYYEFSVSGTQVSNQIAVSRNDMEKIRVVPNPYLGFNVLETSSTNRFVTFRRLPEICTIKIYTLNGDLVKSISKDNTNSDQQWNLRTFEDVPVASGMYIALIDAPGIGQKIIKLAIFTGQERADF